MHTSTRHLHPTCSLYPPPRTGLHTCLTSCPSGPDAPSVSKLTDDLRLLETERDEAVRVGEECARTAVKLEEMVSSAKKRGNSSSAQCKGLVVLENVVGGDPTL